MLEYSVVANRVDATQPKGDSEAHPKLSPDGEFAD
jgi:hypothetical protein